MCAHAHTPLVCDKAILSNPAQTPFFPPNELIFRSLNF